MRQQDALKPSLTDLLSELRTSENGLSDQEVSKRLKEFGPNALRAKGVSALKVLLSQLKSSLIYLLVVASAIAYSVRDYTDGTVILVILLINTILGFLEEYKSARIIQKLTEFIHHEVRVKRGGGFVLVDEENIVSGDVISLREGDIAPADMRLFEVDGLEINESQLTGESAPVPKEVVEIAGAAASCLVFAGSVVEKGSGCGVAYATGNWTELGKIAKLSTETKKETQYEKSLSTFSSFLMRAALLGLILVFIFKLILNGGLANAVTLLLFIIAMAVAVVPEVLPVIATVTLTEGAMKLAKRRVVVKRLSALEDLGNINLLCTDKTGTITENKMKVKKIVSSDEELFQIFAYAAIIPLKGRKRRLQNTYDDAFDKYVSEEVKKEAANFEIIKEVPFDPETRRRRLILRKKGGKDYLLSVGAPEILLKFCGKAYSDKYSAAIAEDGKTGLHQLGIAYKEIDYIDGFDLVKNESEMSFLGYASLEDPLRPTAKEAIQLAERLGVEIKILTGDSREVAEYIGKQIGIVEEGDVVHTGEELDNMSEDEFLETVKKYQIFARISPRQKYNVIKALKGDNVVGYQGDGINDAPALKLADVAIAVNTATDIAKENADIVLLNKSLEVVISGIQYGRSVFVNINKYIKYTMVSNFGNFIALAALYLLSTNLPILPIQVLLTTVITDLPLVTISSDTVEASEVVRPEKHNIRELMLLSLILGIPTALFEIFYFLTIHTDPERFVATSLYVFLTFLAMIVFYAVRGKGSFWRTGKPSTLLNASFLAAFVFSLGIIYVPQFQDWFSFVPLPVESITIIVVLMLFYFIVADFVKTRYYKLTSFLG